MKDKISAFFKRIDKLITPYKKNIIFPLLKIIGIIILCTVLVQIISGNETLAEYAAKNPDKAYQTISVDISTAE